MGSLVIGVGMGMIAAGATLIAGLGIGAALGSYVMGGVLGTLGSAGWLALRPCAPQPQAGRSAGEMTPRLE